MAGGATVGSSRAYRLDPHTLPARCSSLTGGAAEAAFIIERDRAIVGRPDSDGQTFTTTVPVAAYRGVAIRMEAVGDNGDVRAFLELLHVDPSLTLQLAVTDDPEEIAGDWRAWGHALGLPLLVVGQDGSVGEPLAGVRSGIAIARTKPRRRHSYFAARRPRFLTRRKAGRPELMLKLSGREIIARN